MKKIISLFLTFAMALSLCSISVAAAGEISLPINGSKYIGTVTPGTTTYSFTLPQTAGVTDVDVEIYSLPESYSITLRGNGMTPVTYPGSDLETFFTEPSLKSGKYYLDITGTDTSVAGRTYGIVIGTLTHASNNEANPTQLTLGQSFRSNIYRGGREIDYYTFTLTEPSIVSIVAGNTPPVSRYNMVISGRNIAPITVPTVSDFMTLKDEELDPGQYFIKIDSTNKARLEVFETWYSIKVTATPNHDVDTSGHMTSLFTKYGGTIASGYETNKIYVDYPDSPNKQGIYLFRIHQSNPDDALEYAICMEKTDGTTETIQCTRNLDANGNLYVEVPVKENIKDMYITVDSFWDGQIGTYYWVWLEDYMPY